MTRVAVVIPCWNAGAPLAMAVESSVRQDPLVAETIVVADGITDPTTRRLLSGESWSRTRIIHQPHAGPAAARNRGIREASADYILPLDADDLIESTYAAKAAAVLDARPEVGIVYCRATKFGAEEGPWELKPFSPEEMTLGNVIFATAMFRKADWAAVGGYDESLRDGMEDYDFWIRLIGLGRHVVRLDEPLFRYRVSASSRTTEIEADRDRLVATYAKIFRKNRDFFANYAESLYRYRFSLHDEVAALRARLDRESRDAREELAALRAAKAEADRYNESLLAAVRSRERSIAELRGRLEQIRSYFRWLRPFRHRRGHEAGAGR